MTIRIGCAGWSIPKAHTHWFPCQGSHLARYSRIFSAVEVNSSFYRAHRRDTYERWASSVPSGFLFSVKIPRQITHLGKLKELLSLGPFLEQVGGLGDRLGPLLVQLPPSLGFDSVVAGRFLETLRQSFGGPVAMEPRHQSWLSPTAERLMCDFQVARVAADPPLGSARTHPGAWDGLSYYRLHGSPQAYRSSYSQQYLDDLAARLLQSASRPGGLWCIFDNTAQGAAMANALYLLNAVGR
ncbi:MAG: DUF72 domain-containing protein [Thermodesulfobacteriota bacterium]